MANVRGFEFPDELYYLVEQDVWARPEVDGNITVGVTSLAAHLAVEFYGYMPKRSARPSIRTGRSPRRDVEDDPLGACSARGHDRRGQR